MAAAVVREEARIDLARKQLKPDLLWGAGYQYRGGLDPMVMGSFGLKLPLYRDRKQARAIVQAKDEAEAARRDVDAQRLAVAAQVRDLAARATRASSAARLYEEGVIPQSRNALDSAAVAYGVGKADFLTLLTDFSALLTFEIEMESQRADRFAALAALERLTAAELVPVEAGLEPVTGATP
jgi:outer membrane protein TolC